MIHWYRLNIYFHLVLVFFIVNFEHVIAGWAGSGFVCAKIYRIMFQQFFVQLRSVIQTMAVRELVNMF